MTDTAKKPTLAEILAELSSPNKETAEAFKTLAGQSAANSEKFRKISEEARSMAELLKGTSILAQTLYEFASGIRPLEGLKESIEAVHDFAMGETWRLDPADVEVLNDPEAPFDAYFAALCRAAALIPKPGTDEEELA